MRQLDLVSATLRRDLGIARAADGAGDGWVEAAAQWLHWYASHTAHGQPFLVEDAAQVFPGQRAANGKAWGPAVQLARRQGWIVRDGYAPARSSNLSPKCTWRAA